MIDAPLLLAHRFLVSFLAGGIAPNPVDIAFQGVSGLSATVATTVHREGGELLFEHRLPDQIHHDTLVLTRGLAIGSLIAAEFNATMTSFTFKPCNVIVAVLDQSGVPMAGWMFVRAFPVRWQAAPLAAEQPQLLIETLELAFARMQAVSI